MKKFLKQLLFEINSIFGGMKYVLLGFLLLIITAILIPSYFDGDGITIIGVYFTFGGIALVVLIVSSIKALITIKEQSKK